MDLGHIPRAPKALKSLFYAICPPACTISTELRHALASQENCLESLVLEFYETRNTKDEISGSMPSLISLNTLKIFKAVHGQSSLFAPKKKNRLLSQIFLLNRDTDRFPNPRPISLFPACGCGWAFANISDGGFCQYLQTFKRRRILRGRGGKSITLHGFYI